MQSARRPGAIEPSSRSMPKCVAVLIVAICSATSGSSPQSMAWRTTRSMWPSFTSVPGVAVVGAEDEVARVEPLLGDGGDLRLHVVPGRAEPQHRAHPLAHARDGVRLARALVVVGRAAGGVGGKVGEIRARVVPAHRLAGALASPRSRPASSRRPRSRRGSSSSRRGRRSPASPWPRPRPRGRSPPPASPAPAPRGRRRASPRRR